MASNAMEPSVPTFLPGQLVEMMKRAAHWALK
jgi:hypothetical protein